MKKSESKLNLQTLLKPAIFGGLIFAAITVFGMAGCVIFRGDFFGGLYFWAVVPQTQLEILLTGKMSLNPFNGSVFWLIFCCTVINGVLGVFFGIFFQSGIFIIKREIFDKKNYEK